MVRNLARTSNQLCILIQVLHGIMQRLFLPSSLFSAHYRPDSLFYHELAINARIRACRKQASWPSGQLTFSASSSAASEAAPESASTRSASGARYACTGVPWTSVSLVPSFCSST